MMIRGKRVKTDLYKILALVLTLVLMFSTSPTRAIGADESETVTAGEISLNRRPAPEPWDREIKVGEWTISDMGAGGSMPMIGQGPDGLLVVASDLSGVYISYDDGLNWRNAGSAQGLKSMHVASLGFNPVDGDVFFAGTYGYMYSTFDGGHTFYTNESMLVGTDWQHNWVRDDGGARVPFWTAITVSGCGDIVYAAYGDAWDGHTSRIFVSRDGGRTFDADDAWLVGSANGATDFMRVNKMIVHPEDPDTLFLLSVGDAFIQWSPTGRATHGIFRSDFDSETGEVTWIPVTGHPSVTPFENFREGSSVFRDMLMDPANPEIIYMTAAATTQIWAGYPVNAMVENTHDGVRRYAGLFAVNWTTNTLLGEMGVAGTGVGPGYLSARVREDSVTLRTITTGNSPAVREIDITIPGNLIGALPSATAIARINPTFPVLSTVGSAIAPVKGMAQSMYNPDIYFTTGSQWTNIIDLSQSGSFTIEQMYTDRIYDDANPFGRYRGRGLSNVVPHHVAICPHNPNVIYAGHADIGFEFSLDRGRSWTRSNHTGLSAAWGGHRDQGIPNDGTINASGGRGGGALFVAPDPNIPGRVWTAYGYETFDKMLIVSDDNGATWRVPANAGLPGWMPASPNTGVPAPHPNFGGGRIKSVAIDPNSPDPYAPIIYIVCSVDTFHFTWQLWRPIIQGYNVYRSDNGAESWSRLTMPAEAGNIFMSVAVDPKDSNIVYVGAQEGLYRSTDQGATWTRVLHLPHMEAYDYVDSGYNHIGVRTIAISPSNPEIVYVAAGKHTGFFRNYCAYDSGIYKSTDRGLTFTRVYVDYDRTRNLDRFTTSVAVHPYNPNIVFATASNVTRAGGHNPQGFVALSEDGGATWTFVNEGLGSPVAGSVAISTQEPEVVFIGAQGMSMQKRLFEYRSPFTITFDPYGAEGLSPINVAVTPGQTRDTWEEQELLNAALAIGNVYGTAQSPGRAFWGWFKGSTLDDSHRVCPISALRRPALTDSCALEELLALIEEGDDAVIADLFGDATGGNLRVYGIWSPWGDVNDDRLVNSMDLNLLQRYINLNHVMGVVVNQRAADVVVDGNINSADLSLLQRQINFGHLITVVLGEAPQP